ncbi:YARHG domain-containing protein, partial [[Clostridium] symbiosum]
MSREDLRIIRNQFYAVYGRKFQSADLIEYFEAEPWYRGN